MDVLRHPIYTEYRTYNKEEEKKIHQCPGCVVGHCILLHLWGLSSNETHTHIHEIQTSTLSQEGSGPSFQGVPFLNKCCSLSLGYF
jgi:hypothetical protein